jgi:hypothetical protein
MTVLKPPLHSQRGDVQIYIQFEVEAGVVDEQKRKRSFQQRHAMFPNQYRCFSIKRVEFPR